MQTNYEQFLAEKRILSVPAGFNATALTSGLFDFQSDIVDWACRRGKAASGEGHAVSLLDFMEMDSVKMEATA